MPTCQKLAFKKYLFSNYWSAVSVAVCAGVSVVGTAGTAFGSKVLESTVRPPIMKTLENKISANIMVASVQVLLSKKSLVFCTPPICAPPPPPKDDESPPPFGFWTIITTTNKKATIIIKNKNIVNVLMSVLN